MDSTAAFVFYFSRVRAAESITTNVVRCLFVTEDLEAFHFANLSLCGFLRVAIVIVFLIICHYYCPSHHWYRCIVPCIVIIGISDIAIILIIAVLVIDLGGDVSSIFWFHLRFILRDVACDRLNIVSYLVG